MFSEILPGKRVLFIPVYSMRSHETGKYNLMADGNFTRVLSVIKKYKPAYASVTIPAESIVQDINAVKSIVIPGVSLAFCETFLYGVNANGTRKSLAPLDAGDLNDYDAIVSEPQTMTRDLIAHGFRDKLYYWCIATSTDDWPIWFVDEFKYQDRKIAGEVTTIVATESQKESLGANAVVDDFYIPAEKKQILYFPFRPSDPNYEFDMFKLMLNRLRANGLWDKFDVIMPDLNDSAGSLPSYIKKVPSDHAVYQAIINGMPIVPYYEHMDRLPHISIYEMIEARCRIVTWDCVDARKHDTITTVSSYGEFEYVVAEMIRRGL